MPSPCLGYKWNPYANLEVIYSLKKRWPKMSNLKSGLVLYNLKTPIGNKRIGHRVWTQIIIRFIIQGHSVWKVSRLEKTSCFPFEQVILVLLLQINISVSPHWTFLSATYCPLGPAGWDLQCGDSVTILIGWVASLRHRCQIWVRVSIWSNFTIQILW